MKAIPEARMVAARIQGPDRAVRGTSAFVDSITASSHGGFMAAVDASRVDSVWPGLPSIIREFFKNQSRRSQRLNRLIRYRPSLQSRPVADSQSKEIH
jgi:hypothetical protein